MLLRTDTKLDKRDEEENLPVQKLRRCDRYATIGKRLEKRYDW